MIKKPMLAVGVAAVFAIAAGAMQAQTYKSTTPSQSQRSSRMSSQAKVPSQADQKFIKEAIQGDMTEVKMGQLAQEKGQSRSVKQFGQTLESDHSANLQKVKDLAQSMGIAQPSQPSSKQQAIYDRLSKLSGPQFDRQFAQAMVKDHKQDISEFQKQAKKSDPAGQFAQQTLPTLRKHLQIAQSLQKNEQSSR